MFFVVWLSAMGFSGFVTDEFTCCPDGAGLSMKGISIMRQARTAMTKLKLFGDKGTV